MNYESKLTDNWWKIHWEDIQFADRANAKNKSSLSMNKSEASFKTANTGKTSHTTKTSALSSMATTLANVDSSILCGHYKGIRVAVKPLNVPKLNITRENLIEFKQMREIIHNNLVKFIGICVEDTITATVTELSVRGSLKEIITRVGPWENLPENQRHILQNPEELLDRVKAGVLPPFRPEIYPEDCEAPELIPILNLCWGESPNIRPEFAELKQKFKKITRGNLEAIVKNKTEDIIIEKERAEELLNNLLPPFIVEQLKNNTPVLPETFPSVTIMFSDVSGFQQLSKSSNPQQIVNMLNDIYDLLDSILANHDVYKLESINDAYLVASGVPIKNGQEHVREIAYCAIEAREAISKFKARHDPSFNFKLRKFKDIYDQLEIFRILHTLV
ncbi:hypothetical protein RND71_043287 [Anisodus tanguticus]|uniref:Guanylate cyclase domain-containing protein n=1 Tax=Anisodus tanguticus TaxID=243964 RepID=A0AAE1QP16_9SOLA|nr:hypothetical protein RND71_043287 [Anisodus tanguticus]